jgi:hypothetical protein
MIMMSDKVSSGPRSAKLEPQPEVKVIAKELGQDSIREEFRQVMLKRWKNCGVQHSGNDVAGLGCGV